MLALHERLIDRLAPAPAPDAGAGRSDYDLNPGAADPRPDAASLTAAAVLVPIVERGDGLSVLFTRRTDTLRRHAGQVSFPGGRLEPQDADATACALRETEEEIGLERRFIQVFGRLDSYVTVTGFRITPVVGFVTPGFILHPDENEVAEIFEVPLEFLLDPRHHERRSGFRNGIKRTWYSIPYGDHDIWGATAGMVMNLYHKLAPP